jgi:hypothetical protein
LTKAAALEGMAASVRSRKASPSPDGKPQAFPQETRRTLEEAAGP